MSSATSASTNKNPSTVKEDSPNAYEMNFHRDFEPLQMASKVILSALRSDEAAPGSDLYRRLASSTSGEMSSSASSSHVYFPSEKWTPLDSSTNKSSASTLRPNDTMNRSNRMGIGTHSATSPGTPGFRSPNNRTPTMSSPWAHISRSSANNTPNVNQPNFTSPTAKTVHFDKGLSNQSYTPSGKTHSPISTPTTSTPTTVFEHHHSIPLPSHLSKLISSVKVASLMGLLPEANLAWMSVDETLYIWAYDTEENGIWSPSKRINSNSRMEDFCTFVLPSKRNIVSVGLVRPKKGESKFLYYGFELSSCKGTE